VLLKNVLRHVYKYKSYMKINVFEAARRISRLAAATWMISWMVLALNNNMQGDPIYFAIVSFGGLFFILMVTSIIGWIVRKFMGIPARKDRKVIN